MIKFLNRKTVIFISILFFAFFLRIYGINWDQGQHLHPDERFLTMVALAEKIPTNFLTYFVPSLSTLNPYNVGFPFFVYGTFPLTLTKVAAVLFGLDTYADITILGRFLSALFDVGTVFFIFKIAAFFEKKYHYDKKVKYFAGFLYAIAVLPIQLAHFFAVDTFLNFFMVGSVYFSLHSGSRPRVGDGLKPSPTFIFCVIFLGLALASKITAIFILPVVLFFLFRPFLKRVFFVETGSIVSLLMHVVLFLGIVYLTVRFADPHLFKSGNVFNPAPNPLFIQNLKALKSFESKDIWYPPGVQWINKAPVSFALINLAFFGLGIPYFLLLVLGIDVVLRKRNADLLLIFLWLLVFFLYQSTAFVKAMRYLLVIYPFLAIFAGFGLSKIIDADSVASFPPASAPPPSADMRAVGSPSARATCHFLIACSKWVSSLIVFLLLLAWPASFMHIYTVSHSRATASYWINKNVPEGSVLAQEHWDDSLPLLLSDVVNKRYNTVQMPVFDPDTPAKWTTMQTILARADYIIFTSNRGYGSISTVPEKYPQMSQFYADLFSGKLNFIKIKEFTSYPNINVGLFKVEMPDQWSEEAFTVYDHPKVTIFKRI